MLALILPVATVLTAPAETALTLAPDAETRWIPFELTQGNQIRFTMTVDGVPGRAILDTGVTDSFVLGGFATRAGIAEVHREKATAIGGQVDIGWTDRATLEMGALTRRDAPLAIAQGDAFDRFGADIFIGSDMIAGYALDIDYDGHRFRLLPSGRMPFAGSDLPLRQARNGLLFSEVRLGDQRIRPVMVDTGDGSSLTLTRSAWERSGGKDATLTSALGWGMGGSAISDMTVTTALRLGEQPVREAELRIEGPDGFAARTGSAGRIGTGLMLRFRVLLDAGAGHMVIAPGKLIDGRVIRSTSGLLMAPEKRDLRVLHVMRHSPAEHGGWQVGDRICEVDGAAADQPKPGSSPIDWGAGKPGTLVRLTMCNGETRVLTLREFY